MSVDITTSVGTVTFHNPILTASGTFGFGREMSRFYPLSRLGGVVTKALTATPRAGNPPHRVAETKSGMLNAVGLQNPGVEAALKDDLPWLLRQKTRVIVNVAGHDIESYVAVVAALNGSGIDAIELNVSCPNVKAGCMAIGADPFQLETTVRACKDRADVPLWVKLTPNVTSIADMARAAEAGGADAVSLINTLLGMRVDIKTRRPILKNNTGGYSGRGIFPVALAQVSACYRAVSIPIVGLGGIETADDVVEMMLVGASAVQIGTANLIDPYALPTICDDLPPLLERLGVTRVSELIGGALLWPS